MPDIPALADLEGADAASTVFTWKADVKFDPTSASGGGATGVIEQVYTSTPITGASVTFNNDNMWNNVIRGGNVTLTVSATVDGVQLTSDPVHFNIEGSNPGSAAVKGFIELQAVPANWPSGSSYTYSSIMEKIANLESGHTFNQFTADWQSSLQPNGIRWRRRHHAAHAAVQQRPGVELAGERPGAGWPSFRENSMPRFHGSTRKSQLPRDRRRRTRSNTT